MGSRAIEVIEKFKEMFVICTRSVGSFGFVRESTDSLKDPRGFTLAGYFSFLSFEKYARANGQALELIR